MKTRKVYLEKDLAFTAAGTIVTDVNVKDPISFIEILVEMVNGSAMTEASVVKPHDEFTKIELVDGSDVLCSASMEELQAKNAFDLGNLPYMELTLDDDAVQRENCFIMFAPKKYDTNIYLNPGNFNNLQLRITHSHTAAAVTSWAAAGHTITIIAHVIEEGAGENLGFLTHKSHYAYTAVDGAIETIDLPRDFPYQSIMIQALKTANDITLSLEKIKLTTDADRYVPVDIDFDHLVYENATEFGEFFQRCAKRITGAGDVYTDLYKIAHPSVYAVNASGVSEVVAVAGEKVSVELNNIATS